MVKLGTARIVAGTGLYAHPSRRDNCGVHTTRSYRTRESGRAELYRIAYEPPGRITATKTPIEFLRNRHH